MNDDRATSDPRTRIAVGVVVALVAALAGLAFGRGWSPAGLFGSDDPPEIAREAASRVAGDVDESGVSVELLAGPATSGDHECVVVRVAWPDGSRDADAVCGDPLRPWTGDDFAIVRNSEYFGGVIETPIGSAEDGYVAAGLSGWVHPDVVAITATLGDGSQYSFSPTPPDGWFATVVPSGVADLDRSTGYLVNGVVSLRLFDSESRALTTIDTAALLAQPAPG